MPHLTRDERLRCALLRSLDWEFQKIAAYIGCTERQAWYACQGPPTSKKHSGRPLILSDEQVQEVIEFIASSEWCCLHYEASSPILLVIQHCLRGLNTDQSGHPTNQSALGGPPTSTLPPMCRNAFQPHYHSFLSTWSHNNSLLHLPFNHGKRPRMVVPQGPYDRSTPSVRKRRIPSCSSPALEATTNRRSPKRQKVCHPAVPPSRFWDHLSEIPLTRNALRELGNRNAKVSHGSPATRTCCETGCHQLTDLFSPTDLRRITRFARHGGPDLKDLRGYPIPTGTKARMSSNQPGIRRRKRSSRSPKKSSQSPSKSNNTTTTRSTGPYDRAFQQHLVDHNILPDGYEYPDGRLPPEPENMDEILRALSQPRQSLSPSRFSKDDFRKFQREDAQASKERQVTTTIIPIIEGDVGDKKCVAGEIPFTNLNHLTDGTLVPGNPDIYYGARPEQLDRSIRKCLGGHVMPSTQEDFPVAPNFFIEVKGHDGSTAVAKRQLSYDMALGARGINTLQGYNSSNLPYDNRAYTLGCTYQAGIIKMYASQPILPSVPGGQPGYNMTQLKVLALTNDAEAFRQGATAYRNGRDWAKRQRDDAINQANDRASHEMVESFKGDGIGLSFASEASASDIVVASQDIIPNRYSNVPSSEESEASADELSLDFQPPVKRRNSGSPQKKS